MASHSTGIWVVILVFLSALLTGILKFFQNKQSQDESKKIEQDSKTQLDNTEQKAKRELHSKLRYYQ